jgi:hypothetical protein
VAWLRMLNLVVMLFQAMTYEGDWWCAGSRACDGGVGCLDSGVGSDCNGGSS